MNAKVLKSDDVVVLAEQDPAGGARLRSALQEAYEHGLAEGERVALAGMDDALAQLRRALTDVGTTARDAIVETVQLDAETVTRLAADLATWFLDGAIQLDPNTLLVSLQGALSGLADQGEVILSVHPDVAAAIGDDQPAGVDVVRADASLGRADYRLAANGSVIERRWSDAIDAITAEIAGAIRSSDTANPRIAPSSDMTAVAAT